MALTTTALGVAMDALADAVYRAVPSAGTLEAGELVAELRPRYGEESIKRAMWRLISEGQLDLDGQLRLIKGSKG